jgi:hypothetical protein
MATLNLRRFSSPESLRAIRPDRLVALLEPHREYFRSRGVQLPRTGASTAPDYDQLADAFMRTDHETPALLLDAIYYVTELADEVGLDGILEAFKGSRHALENDGKQSPADVAVQAWLLDPDLVRDLHAERQVHNKKSFEHFRPRPRGIVPWKHPSDETLRAIEKAMDPWFVDHHRGPGSRITVFTDSEPYWLLVRHGKTLERAGVMEKGETKGLVFRPMIYDVLIYDPRSGELRINTTTKGERDLYRKQLGRHLFGNEDYFAVQVEYTLAPLRDRGVEALNCEDVDGIDSIVLRQIELWHGGPLREVEIHRADDVFAAFATRRSGGLPTSGALRCAKFNVKFTGAATPRIVTIRLPISTSYVRDDDSTILEGWMRKQKFLVEV